MYIKELSLRNFRNYEKIDIKFNRENNLLIGDNGQGKTNILESIYILGMVKSFRSVLDKDLMRWDSDSYFIKAIYNESDYDTTINIGYHNGKKQAQENQTVVEKLSSLVGSLKVVVFTHNDTDLIIGAPSKRRRYLDITLSLVSKKYFKLLQSYQKVVKQRNMALKNAKKDRSQTKLVSIWDEQLVEYGSEIITTRHAFFDPINELTTQLYNSLQFGVEDFKIDYRSSLGSVQIELNESNSVKTLFQKKLNENIDREIQYRQTLYGPHKDDFSIRSGDVEFKRFASQGQSRGGALTLKLAMTQYIEQMTKTKTILLLDDILLDLDNEKKDRFLSLVQGRQNFFTATSLYGLESITANSSIFNVSDDQIAQEENSG